jgi:hypothetical protein
MEGTIDAVYNDYRLHIEGGVVKGNGTIRGHIDNSGGKIQPGMSAGTIIIDGGFDYNDYTQGPAGMLDIEIGGPTAGSGYDQLIVNGAAYLDGTLRVRFIGGYSPHAGQTFDVLIGTVVGQFATLDLPPCISVTYLPDRVRLTRQCAGDVKCSGGVNVNDLLAVISAWGPCPPMPAQCTSDIVPNGGDGLVNVNDLLAVISGWGSCP